MFSHKRIFITGGAGFIGSCITRHLLTRGDPRIFLFDNLARNALQYSEARDHPAVTFIKGDVLDGAALNEAMRQAEPTHVIHCAGIAGIDTVIKDPVLTMEVNMLGSANCLRAASGIAGLERFITFSTSEVFGQYSFNDSEEAKAVIGNAGEARWTYAVSKLASEHLSFAYHQMRRTPTVVIRPFNVYGPGQVGEGALSIFIKRAIRDEDLIIYGAGNQIRSWCYVDDFVAAIETMLTHPGAVGRSFNIGNPRTVVTVYGLAAIVVRVLQSHSRILFVDQKSIDVELRVPNVALAKQLLGFEAKVELEEGIAKTAEYYRQFLTPNG